MTRPSLVCYTAVMIINTYDAKTNLSKLLARVEAGETITIAKAGKPIAELKPHSPAKTYYDMIGTVKPQPTDATKRVRKLRDNWR